MHRIQVLYGCWEFLQQGPGLLDGFRNRYLGGIALKGPEVLTRFALPFWQVPERVGQQVLHLLQLNLASLLLVFRKRIE